MSTLTEVLPSSKSGPAAVRWAPADPNDPLAPYAGNLPAAGTLVIDRRRASVSYAVVEFPCGWDGRAFHLEELPGSAGTDAEGESCDVFCAANGQDRSCSCNGFERHGHCQHHAAVAALLENGWL